MGTGIDWLGDSLVAHRTKNREALRALGSAIKRIREGAGLTQSSLASRAGMPVRTLVNYEQGHREPPSLALFTLVNAMGCKLSDFQPECDSLGTKPVVEKSKRKKT
jgi:Predicted transcriptional regulators